jgi:hypothetical protein
VLRRISSGLLASAISLLLLAALLELGFRVFGIGEDPIAQAHPWVGWTHIPSRRAEIPSEDRSLGRRLHVTIDSLGLRDVERTAAKPAGVTRVLVLGDSYVEAVQVPLESTLTRRLERALDGANGRRVEVWNTGVAGYSTTQELLYLSQVAPRFHPDVVVLCFLSGNDIADQVPPLATSLRNRPFFRLQRDPAAGDTDLVLDGGFLRPDSPPIGWLRLHSRLFGWVSLQRRVVQTNLRVKAETGGGAAHAAAAAAIPASFQIYAEHPDSLWAGAWDLTDRLIVATRDEAERQGARFLLVSISNGVQEHAKARERWPGWSDWRDRPGIDLDAPEHRLAALSAAHGIDYLPLLDGFRAEQARTGAPLHIEWTGHWNSAGHALAARLIGERLAPLLPPPAR